MKQTGMRAIIMMIIAGLFLSGVVFFGVEYVIDGKDWALYPSNTHIFKDGQINRAGAVKDRDDTVLVETKDGKRVYNSDEKIRMSTLHAVGDLDGEIETGIQHQFLGTLCDYNMIDGVYQHSNKGNDIKTTLSAKVCADVYSALDGRTGTVGVYNYKTGELICMVSTPTYDVESQEDSEKAKSGEYKGVYINRFLSATYTPGSTFKIITSAAGIDTFKDIYTREYTCNGGVEIDGEWISCMGNHGTQTLKEAFSHSCNAYFSQLAVDVGKEKMMEYAGKAGFNRNFSLDGIDAKTSFFDVTNTRNIDLAWAGMGQYTNMMNPLQYLTMLGGIANGGTAIEPYFIDSVKSPLGLPLKFSVMNSTKDIFSSSTC